MPRLHFLAWVPLQELLEQYECLPRAVEGNLVTCAADGHQGQALVHLAPSTNLFKFKITNDY